MDGENRKDLILCGIVGALLCMEVLLMLHQMRILTLPMGWGISSPAGPAVAKVVDKRNDLNHRTSSSLSWYPITKGDAVGRNDTLMTGTNSSARIKLRGEGEVEMDAETLISFLQEEIAAKTNVLTLDVDHGILRVTSRSQPVKLIVKRQEIRLNKESEVVIARAPMQTAPVIKVTKGQMSVAPISNVRESTTVLKAGESAVIKASITAVRLNLKIVPKFPRPSGTVFKTGANDRVKFQWSGDTAERLEIDKRDDFISPKRFRAAENEADVELSTGHYFWRLATEEAVGPTFDFTVMPEPNYRALSPRPQTSFAWGIPLSLRWNIVEEAKQYDIQLSQDPNFEQLVVSRSMIENSIDIGPLGSGRYYWRIRAQHEELGYWPYSETYTFRIKYKPLVPPKIKGFKILKQS